VESALRVTIESFRLHLSYIYITEQYIAVSYHQNFTASQIYLLHIVTAVTAANLVYCLFFVCSALTEINIRFTFLCHRRSTLQWQWCRWHNNSRIYCN